MKTYRTNGKVIIEIPEQNILDATPLIPNFGAGLRVVDKDKFLNYFADNLLEAGAENGMGYVLGAFEQVIVDCIDKDAGLEENQNYN